MNHRLMIQATRIGLYLIVVVLTLLNHLLQDNFFNWGLALSFYSISSLGLLMHLLTLINLDYFFEKRGLVFFSFFLDVALISFLMVSSSLNQTLFLFLYLVTIILAGLVFQLRGALLMAALTSIGFTIGSWFGPEIKAMAYLFMLILNNLSFFTVAGLAGYLSDQLNLFAEKIEVQNLSLRVIRRLNEMIVETIPSALLTVNQKSEILQFNPGAAHLFKQADLETIALFQLLPELALKIPDLSQLRSGEKHELRWQLSPEQDPSLLSLQILPQVTDLGEPTYLVVVEDLTEKRRLEYAVRQSEKMAAVGGLAAGIAHEIRNPLAGISGSVELLSQNFQTEDDKKLAKIILREIDRLNRLISEFLDFAKPEKPPGEIVELNSILNEVIANAESSLTKPVTVEKDLASATNIMGHRDKLKQAFLNIVINSMQAMNDRENRLLRVRTIADGETVQVRIQDSGVGMSPETRKRMFEPFHTTKPKGTGLGLAITHKILEGHQAQIFVESEQGLGTEFVITFPAKNN